MQNSSEPIPPPGIMGKLTLTEIKMTQYAFV
uniref:Uncharacterized protein n=1 Tax=Anguilla anguilla TaxID=7936 RepID=A0A0E9QX53_ANGAN